MRLLRGIAWPIVVGKGPCCMVASEELVPTIQRLHEIEYGTEEEGGLIKSDSRNFTKANQRSRRGLIQPNSSILP